MKNLTTKVRSLRLISLDRYSQVYSMLKDKYGTDLVKVMHNNNIVLIWLWFS